MKFDQRNHQEVDLLQSTHPLQANLEAQQKRRLCRRSCELLAEAVFLEKKKTAQHQADEFRVQEELAKANARMEILDAEESSRHIETPRRMLNFGNDKSAIKPEMNTFDQDVETSSVFSNSC